MLLRLSLCIIFALQVSKSIDISSLSKEELLLQVRDLQHQVSLFQDQVSLLQRLVFGPRSERFKVSDEVPANQLSLGVTTDAIGEVEVKKTTIKAHDRAKVKLVAKKHPGRMRWSGKSGHKISLNLCQNGPEKQTKISSEVRFPV